MEIVYVYTKKRKEFGRHTGHFADRAAQVEFEIPGDEEIKENYMEKNPCVLEMHCIASISEHAANTNVTVFVEKGMKHEEGGWPREVDPSEPEQRIRFTCALQRSRLACLHPFSIFGCTTRAGRRLRRTTSTSPPW